MLERYRFWSRRQQEAETIDQWVMDLRTQANNCEFGDQRELIIRDMLVFGIRDDRTKERLLREAKLTLQAALYICRETEASQLQVQAMAKNPSQIEVHAMEAREQKEEQVYTGKTGLKQRNTHPNVVTVDLLTRPGNVQRMGRHAPSVTRPTALLECQWKGGTSQPVHY